MGGGGGGSLSHTNPITPAEASADYTGAVGQAQNAGVWAAPTAQGVGGFAAAPTVDAYYNPAGGVQTGIPQGGFAAPAIAQYFAGPGTGPQVSYRAGQHDPWLGDVEAATAYNQNVLAGQAAQQEAARQAAESGIPLPESIPRQEGSFLRQDEFADLQARAAAGDQEAADTLYNNQLAAQGAAQDGGIWASIRGHGDEQGSSLATGAQSNVGLQDRAIALGEQVGQFSPLVGGVTGAVADRIAPRDENQRDVRNAQEVSIARHTQNWAEQAPDQPITLTEYTGPTVQAPTEAERRAAANNNDDHVAPTHEEILARHRAAGIPTTGGAQFERTPEQSAAASGFDMNDPSTWRSGSDSRESGNDNDGGSSGDDSGGK